MKGDSGTAVIAIIVLVIAVVVLFLYFGGSGALSVFGLSYVQPIVYSNDIITVSDKFVSDNVPYTDQETTIEFTVKNNGRGATKGVQVILDPPTGFTSQMKCGDRESCTFDLPEGDSVNVLITLKAISGVTQIIPTDVRYSVKYPYEGFREIHIPIAASKDTLPKGQVFFVSDATYGPIQLSVTPPQPRPTADGGSAEFAVSGISVEVGFRVDNVGGGGFGTVKQVVLRGGDASNYLKFSKLDNLDIVFCDKIDATTKELKAISGISKIGQTGFEVPFDISCTLKPTGKGDITDGLIRADYKYDYEIDFSEKFSILPKCVPKIQSTSGLVTPDENCPTGGATASSDSTTSGSAPSDTSSSTPNPGSSSSSSGNPTDITLSTDKSSSYAVSDTVKINGITSPGTTISIQVFDPNNGIKQIFQLTASSSGSFSSPLSPIGGLKKGTWTVTALTTPGGLKADTTFVVN